MRLLRVVPVLCLVVVGCRPEEAPRTRTVTVVSSPFRNDVRLSASGIRMNDDVLDEKTCNAASPMPCQLSHPDARYLVTFPQTGPQPMRVRLAAPQQGLIRFDSNSSDWADVYGSTPPFFKFELSANENPDIVNANVMVDFSTRVPISASASPARPVLLNGGEILANSVIETQAFDALGGLADQRVSIARAAGERCIVQFTPSDVRFTLEETADDYAVRLPSPLTHPVAASYRPIESLTFTFSCVDESLEDAGSVDAGVVDAGSVDAGTEDAGVFDAGVPDAGQADAGAPDAGVAASVPAFGVCDPMVFSASNEGRVQQSSGTGAALGSFFPFGLLNDQVRVVTTRGGRLFALNLVNGQLRSFLNGVEQWRVTPVGGHGASLAACDVDLDGFDDAVVGTGAGYAPQMGVVSAAGVVATPFAAFTSGTGGVSVACGDVTGDGVVDLVAGPGFGSNNSIRVMNALGTVLTSFQPYGSTFSSGVNVAVGRFVAAQRLQTLVGPRSGAAANVQVFLGTTETATTLAFPSTYLDGVSVAAGDLDGDGFDEAVIGQLTGSTVSRFTVSGANFTSAASFMSPTTTGLSVSAMPLSSWGCATTDAGVPDAGGTSSDAGTRDAGAGCTADEGHLVGALTAQSGRVFTRIIARDGTAYFLTAGSNLAGLYRAPLDGGPVGLLAAAIVEPTGLVVDDGDVYFSDKGNFGSVNGGLLRQPLDGGPAGFLVYPQDFPIDLAKGASDAGAQLYWPTSGNGLLHSADLLGQNQATSSALLSLVAFTLDATHAYFATAGRIVERTPLDFSSAHTSVIGSNAGLDPIQAMQVVGNQLYVLTQASGGNPRTRVVRMNVDGTGSLSVVVTVNGGSARFMHVVNGFVYVSESGFAPGCQTARVWRVPANALLATSVEPVANSSEGITDFDVGPTQLLLLRNAVWSVP